MSKNNNFNFLRLLFAYLVIVSHSPVLIDQNESREILFQITGSYTFGRLAVDGFFLISGYLICQSYESSKTLFSYLAKRALRIYPAFIVCTLFCLYIFLPLTGNSHLLKTIDFFTESKYLLKSLALSTPYIEGVSLNSNVKIINGSVWTIRYEFICYLMIPLIALLGLTKRRVLVWAVSIMLIYIYFIANNLFIVIRNEAFLVIRELLRFSTTFLIGICFYKFKDVILWNRHITITCLVCLISLTFLFPKFGGLGLMTFGAYLLFNFALNYKNKITESIGSRNDISYGVYLYAWPIQILFIHHVPDINPWMLTFNTVALATLLGFASWILIEKPFIQLKKRYSL
jgi:peptidoglycan/LPS O-acetylase OafA/YrhL